MRVRKTQPTPGLVEHDFMGLAKIEKNQAVLRRLFPLKNRVDYGTVNKVKKKVK